MLAVLAAICSPCASSEITVAPFKRDSAGDFIFDVSSARIVRGAVWAPIARQHPKSTLLVPNGALNIQVGGQVVQAMSGDSWLGPLGLAPNGNALLQIDDMPDEEVEIDESGAIHASRISWLPMRLNGVLYSPDLELRACYYSGSRRNAEDDRFLLTHHKTGKRRTITVNRKSANANDVGASFRGQEFYLSGSRGESLIIVDSCSVRSEGTNPDLDWEVGDYEFVTRLDGVARAISPALEAMPAPEELLVVVATGVDRHSLPPGAFAVVIARSSGKILHSQPVSFSPYFETLRPTYDSVGKRAFYVQGADLLGISMIDGDEVFRQPVGDYEAQPVGVAGNEVIVVAEKWCKAYSLSSPGEHRVLVSLDGPKPGQGE
ncbi:MAG: hypothetical protein KF774_21070 [Planctomyces sp.]|nr:hypothetical protein [Planctomyces sp.]